MEVTCRSRDLQKNHITSMVTTTDMTAAAIAVTKNVAATGTATDEAEETKMEEKSTKVKYKFVYSEHTEHLF